MIKILFVIFKILVFALSVFLSGCAESNFDLSPTSRIPKWFDLPVSMNRADVQIELEYYIMPWGRTATVVMRSNKGQRIKTVKGKLKGGEPLTLTPHQMAEPSPYPSYEVITVKGVADIVEHRKQEPVFYMTDDPTIWTRFVTSIKSKQSIKLRQQK
jgi:hypothetical protein